MARPSSGWKRSATSSTAGKLIPLKDALIEREKNMQREISRRSFLKKSAIALCTVVLFDFTSIGGADQVSGLNTLSSEKLREQTR